MLAKPSFGTLWQAFNALSIEDHLKVSQLYVYDHRDRLLLTVPLPEDEFETDEEFLLRLQKEVYHGLKDQS